MNIIMFLLGILCGFGGKLGFDYYHEFIKRQEKSTLAMEDILVNWKAIEKLKEIK